MWVGLRPWPRPPSPFTRRHTSESGDRAVLTVVHVRKRFWTGIGSGSPGARARRRSRAGANCPWVGAPWDFPKAREFVKSGCLRASRQGTQRPQQNNGDERASFVFASDLATLGHPRHASTDRLITERTPHASRRWLDSNFCSQRRAASSCAPAAFEVTVDLTERDGRRHRGSRRHRQKTLEVERRLAGDGLDEPSSLRPGRSVSQASCRTCSVCDEIVIDAHRPLASDARDPSESARKEKARRGCSGPGASSDPAAEASEVAVPAPGGRPAGARSFVVCVLMRSNKLATTATPLLA